MYIMTSGVQDQATINAIEAYIGPSPDPYGASLQLNAMLQLTSSPP